MHHAVILTVKDLAFALSAVKLNVGISGIQSGGLHGLLKLGIEKRHNIHETIFHLHNFYCSIPNSSFLSKWAPRFF